MRFLLIAVTILFVQICPAQSLLTCGTDLFQSLRATKDPAWEADQKHLTETFNTTLRHYAKTATEGISGIDHIDTIALAVHVVHTGGAIGTKFNPSDEVIQNAIEIVNQIFAGTSPGSETGFDMGVRFILAKRNPQCAATTGIDRIDGTVLEGYSRGVYISAGYGVHVFDIQNLIKWDPQKYLNVWLVNKLDDGNVYGVGYYPIDPLFGVIVESEGVGPYSSVILAHELGHTIFLLHPFEGGDENTCPSNTDCNIDGDCVCDTDPIKRPTAAQGCRTGINPCTGTDYTVLTEHNIMNYNNCQKLFTAGQHVRAKAALATLPKLQSLLHSDSRFAPKENNACFSGLILNGELSQHTARLWWDSDNLNADYYLERSYDGFHFQTIAVFPFPAGSNSFTYSDHSITQQSNSYRFYQEVDSNKIYSNTVIVMDSTLTVMPVSLLGNPVGNTLDIQIGDIPQKTTYVYSTTLSLRLMNLPGQTILKYSAVVSNNQRVRIPIAFLHPGAYILQAIINDKLFVFQVLKN